MHTRTKDRLLTAGAVLLICAGGFSTPGCSTVQPHNSDDSLRYVCTTDSDCELHERLGTVHREAPQRWKLWTSIGVGVLVTGYLYAHSQHAGGAGQQDSSLNATIQPVTCIANDCAK